MTHIEMTHIELKNLVESQLERVTILVPTTEGKAVLVAKLAEAWARVDLAETENRRQHREAERQDGRPTS